MTMKKGLVVFIACFAGAFLALQINGYLNDRRPAGTLETAMKEPIEAPIRYVSSDSVSVPVDFRTPARKLMPSVVSVDTVREQETWFGERYATRGSGSGVVVSRDGYILTNSHVIEGATSINVQFNDGRSMVADLIGHDPRSDLAVLKVKASDLVAAELGRSSALEVGEWVIAIGNPLGYENTVSVGVVSSLGRTLQTSRTSVLVDAIQTDAAINPGNSGGALANAKGQIVGINTAIASQSGGSEGIGFAIPIDFARRVVEDIRQYGRVRYGYMGVNTFQRSGLLKNPGARAELKDRLGSEPPQDGLLVNGVVRSGPGEKSGIKPFDVLLEIDGKKLAEPVDMQRLLIKKRPGERVQVKYWSQGRVQTVSVTLEDLS